MTKPVLLLDTCALIHLDNLGLGRRPLIEYLIQAFELRVSPVVFDEIRRHSRRMNLQGYVNRKKVEWRMRHNLNDSCFNRLLQDLPNTPSWYPHNRFYPDNEQHLFAPNGNAGERELFLLFLELSYSGQTPILLTDDFRACRLALRDLIEVKIRMGILWITLDFIIYITMTGLKRFEGKTCINRFRLQELRMVIRDLVLRVSAQQQMQQQLLTHYLGLAEMVFNLVDGNDAFTHLEKLYGNNRYR